MTSFGGQTITYDAMGNPESYLGRTLSWEGKQLTSVIDGTHSYTYSYNEDGLRPRKVVDGTDTEYYYNGSVLMYMITGSGSTAVKQRFSYDADGNLVAVVYKNGTSTAYTYYYLRNAQGDIVKLIDSNGNTLVEYLYDSWGKLLSVTGTLATTLGADQPFRYRGYVYDEETGWYYLQSRYYDPETCRFISADVLLSTGQGVIGHNSFAYCLNNPICRVDEGGNYSRTIATIYHNHCYGGGGIANGCCRYGIYSTIGVAIKRNGNGPNLLKTLMFINNLLKKAGYSDVYVIVTKDEDTHKINGVEIKNSNKIKSRIERLAVCIILASTGKFKQSPLNLSAEWFGHNVVFFFDKSNGSAEHVNFEFEGDGRTWVRAITYLLEFCGLY